MKEERKKTKNEKTDAPTRVPLNCVCATNNQARDRVREREREKKTNASAGAHCGHDRLLFYANANI